VVRLQFKGDAIRALKEHAERQMMSHVHGQADKLQGVYDRVLDSSQGKTENEVKALLIQEWRSTFGNELGEPQLSAAASVLAEGRRIKVQTEIKK